MQINHYFENYINNLQKDIFTLAYDLSYDIIPFITAYMKSSVRSEMDKTYTSWHTQPTRRILEEALSETNNKKVEEQTINRDAVEWLGFFYSKWHFLTGESSKTILRFLSAKEGLKKYFTLHQLDETEAIEICKRQYNLSRNNHRTYEQKNGAALDEIFDNQVYYSYLAIRMLYKLTKNRIYINPYYVGDRQEYDFLCDEYDIGIKCDVISKSNNKSIIEIFARSDGGIIVGSQKCEKSIYFCFVFSPYYEIDDNGDEKLLEHINELKKTYTLNVRCCDYVYFYMLGKLYEITPSNELYVYSMPFSKRERAGVINAMKNNRLL